MHESQSAKLWRMPDRLWDRIRPFLPVHRNTHPLGGGRPRRSDRDAMDAIFHILRTGAQWNSLNATGICSSSTAHRRFQEWVRAGVFWKAWCAGLMEYDGLKGIDWSWVSGDGAMTKAPLAGEKNRAQSTDRAKSGTKRSLLTDGAGVPIGLAVGGANVNDFRLLRETIASIPVDRPRPGAGAPQGMCLDKGYDYDEVRELLAEFGFTAHIRSRGEEGSGTQTLGAIPRPPLGRRTDAQLDEPLPPRADPLGKEGRELLRRAASGARLHHAPMRGSIIGIGPKGKRFSPELCLKKWISLPPAPL